MKILVFYKNHYDYSNKDIIKYAFKKYPGLVFKTLRKIKDDIKTMCKQHKMPKDYGIRVRNASIEMSITAANKMRNTKQYKGYDGVIYPWYEKKYIEKLEINLA